MSENTPELAEGPVDDPHEPEVGQDDPPDLDLLLDATRRVLGDLIDYLADPEGDEHVRAALILRVHAIRSAHHRHLRRDDDGAVS